MGILDKPHTVIKFESKFSQLLYKAKLMDRLKIKIKFEKPLLYVDAEREFVKCTLKGVMYLPKNVAVSLGLPSEVKVASRTEAQCRQGDVFSAEKGTKIAVAKAERNIYRNAAERLVRRWKAVNDVEVDYLTDPNHPTLNTGINAFVAKANGCVSHNERYIQEIAG